MSNHITITWNLTDNFTGSMKKFTLKLEKNASKLHKFGNEITRVTKNMKHFGKDIVRVGKNINQFGTQFTKTMDTMTVSIEDVGKQYQEQMLKTSNDMSESFTNLRKEIKKMNDPLEKFQQIIQNLGKEKKEGKKKGSASSIEKNAPKQVGVVQTITNTIDATFTTLDKIQGNIDTAKGKYGEIKGRYAQIKGWYHDIKKAPNKMKKEYGKMQKEYKKAEKVLLDIKKRGREAKEILDAIEWPTVPITVPKFVVKGGKALKSGIQGKVETVIAGAKGVSYRAKDVATKVKTFSSNVGEKASSYGKAILENKKVVAVHEGMSAMGNWVKERKIVKGIAKRVGKGKQAVGNAVGSVAKGTKNYVKQLGVALQGVNKAFVTFFGTTGTMIIVIGALILAGVLLYKNWDKIKKGAKALGRYIKKMIKSSGINIKGLKKQFKAIGKDIKLMGKEISSFVKKIYRVLKPIGKWVSKFFVKVFKVAFSVIIGYGSGFITGVTTVVGGIIRVLKGIIKFVVGTFTGNWKKAWQGVKDIFGGIWESLVGLVKTPFNSLIGMINSVTGSISDISIDIPLFGEFTMPQIPKIPMLYTGTMNWGGGPAMVHDRGAEIIDLPKGSRVYPHDKSLQMARAEGAKAGKVNVSIGKLADTMVVRSEEDIRSIADRVVKDILNKICDVSANIGGVELGDFA